MRNEAAVKNAIRKLLKARNIDHISITTGGFGSSGWPDICFLYKGVFVGIECKYGKNKPSVLQEQKLDYIKAQGARRYRHAGERAERGGCGAGADLYSLR